MPFKKGASGNPNGRPVKNRALTAILEAAGNTKTEYDGKNTERRKILAELLWQVALTGKATLPDNQELAVAPQDWFGIVKFIYNHIDGAAKSELDVTSAGEKLNVIISYEDPDDFDTD